jgi:hypothetical protein
MVAAMVMFAHIDEETGQVLWLGLCWPWNLLKNLGHKLHELLTQERP